MIPLPYLAAAVVPVGYQLASLAASLRFLFRRVPAPAVTAPVSVLKPIAGLDEGFEEAIESHAAQDHPEFEILFGVHSLDDPAVPAIRNLIAAHPDVPIRLIHSRRSTPNAKVGTLMDLSAEARHRTILVNDSDVTVPPDYLRRVAAPLLADADIGLVTCIYKAVSSSPAGRWEAFGIATDFIPSTLVAPMVGVREFGLGSTLCFRRADLDAIGGFEAVASFIADDYQLAKRIVALGKRAHLSETVVETHLSDPSMAAVWSHQVRWARTIRVCRGGGYAGLPVTHAGVWMLAFLALGQPQLAAACWIARSLAAYAGGAVVGHWPAMLGCWAAPLWDLWAFAVWIAGWAGDTVEWRNARYKISREGLMTLLDR
jgi:ceramide glucosyltransferase